MRIALLDHDRARSETFAAVLRRDLDVDGECVACVAFERVEALRPALRDDTFDLLMLEWSVPDLDGVDLMQWVRGFLRSSMAVMLIGSRHAERDVSGALGLGADDYLVRPCRSAELCARVEGLMAQRAARDAGHAGWALEAAGRSVRITADDGRSRTVTLTEREFRLARALFRHRGRAVSRSYLIETLGAHGAEVPSRALDSHVYRLRHKLQLDASAGLDLQTVYGRGYRLAAGERTDLPPPFGAPHSAAMARLGAAVSGSTALQPPRS